MTIGAVAYAGGMFAGPAPAAAAVTADARPILALEIAFTTEPGDPIPAWTDVTDTAGVHRLRSWTTSRGRRRPLDPVDAGRFRVTLDNRDRAFDPTHTAGPYFGSILPMRRIRLKATWAAATYYVFDGYIDSWSQDYEPPREAVTVIEATDATKIMAATLLPDSVYESEVRTDNPFAWWRLGDPSGALTAIEAVSGNNGTVVGTPSFGQAPLSYGASDTAVKFTDRDHSITLPPGAVPTSTAWSIEFLTRRDTDVYSTVVETKDYFGVATPISIQLTGGGDNVYVEVGEPYTGPVASTGAVTDIAVGGLYHVVVVGTVGSTLKIYVNGADDTNNAGGNVPAPLTASAMALADNFRLEQTAQQPTVTFDELAFYCYALSDARIAAHAAAALNPWDGDTPGERIARILDTVGWPAGDRDLDDGSTLLGPVTLASNTNTLAYLRKIEETEGGALFVTAAGDVRFRGRDGGFANIYTDVQATFGDHPASELPYGDIQYDYADAIIYNDVRVSRDGGVEQRVEDAASQGTYLRRTLSRTGLLHDSDTESRYMAEHFLFRYKDAVLRVQRLTVYPTRSPNELFPVVLGLDLLYRTRVIRRPQAVGTAIDQEATVQGVTHAWEATNRAWTTTYDLWPADVEDYWLLGVTGYSELGETTILGY